MPCLKIKDSDGDWKDLECEFFGPVTYSGEITFPLAPGAMDALIEADRASIAPKTAPRAGRSLSAAIPDILASIRDIREEMRERFDGINAMLVDLEEEIQWVASVSADASDDELATQIVGPGKLSERPVYEGMTAEYADIMLAHWANPLTLEQVNKERATMGRDPLPPVKSVSDAMPSTPGLPPIHIAADSPVQVLIPAEGALQVYAFDADTEKLTDLSDRVGEGNGGSILNPSHWALTDEHDGSVLYLGLGFLSTARFIVDRVERDGGDQMIYCHPTTDIGA